MDLNRAAHLSQHEETSQELTKKADDTLNRWQQMKKLSGPFAHALREEPKPQPDHRDATTTTPPSTSQSPPAGSGPKKRRYRLLKKHVKTTPVETNNLIRWSRPGLVGQSKLGDGPFLAPRPKFAEMTLREQLYLGLRVGSPRLQQWLEAEAADQPLDLSQVKPGKRTPSLVFGTKEGGNIATEEEMPDWILHARLEYEAAMSQAKSARKYAKMEFYHQWRRRFDMQPSIAIHAEKIKRRRELTLQAKREAAKEHSKRHKTIPTPTLQLSRQNSAGASHSDK